MTKFLPALLAATLLPGAAMAAQMSAQPDATAKPAMHKTMAHKTTKTKTYDCTKAGNANKKACKH